MKTKIMTLAATGLLAVATNVAPAAIGAASAQRMGNPATAYCKRIGGRSVMRNTPAGEVGYCRLRNGRVVDEWQLFRESNARRKPANRRGQPIGAPNPAGAYCEEQGGLIKNRMTEEGEVGYCHLPGGRVVEEWEFFRQSQGQ